MIKLLKEAIKLAEDKNEKDWKAYHEAKKSGKEIESPGIVSTYRLFEAFLSKEAVDFINNMQFAEGDGDYYNYVGFRWNDDWHDIGSADWKYTRDMWPYIEETFTKAEIEKLDKITEEIGRAGWPTEAKVASSGEKAEAIIEFRRKWGV